MEDHVKFAPWIQYDIAQWGPLTDPRYLTHFQAKTIIYNQQDELSAIYILKNGRVRLSCSSRDGEEKVYLLGLSGCMFGEETAFFPNAHFLYAIALSQCDVYRIPKDEFLYRLSQDIDLNAKVLSSISHKLHITMEHVRRLCFLDARQRIAAIFVDMACVFGTREQRSVHIKLPITQQEIGNMVNASRMTVNQIINEFTEQGLIVKKAGQWIIHDAEGLKRISDNT